MIVILWWDLKRAVLEWAKTFHNNVRDWQSQTENNDLEAIESWTLLTVTWLFRFVLNK